MMMHARRGRLFEGSTENLREVMAHPEGLTAVPISEVLRRLDAELVRAEEGRGDKGTETRREG